jgi:hypothetical protein
MSTARDELARICVGENANMEEYRNDFNKVHQVIRYSQRYAEALGAAQKLVREAEAFTQGDEYKRLAIADAITQQHRSHQQGFVRGVVIPALAALEFNADAGQVDARNQGAATFAKAALEAADENNTAWLPFI